MKLKKIVVAMGIGLFTMTLSACGTTESKESSQVIPQEDGEEKVVATSVAVTEILDALGSDYMALFEQNNIPAEFISLQSLDGLKEGILTLGARFNVEEKATDLIAQIEAVETSIQEEVANLEKKQILLLFGAPGSTMIATEKSYIGNLVEKSRWRKPY